MFSCEFSQTQNGHKLKVIASQKEWLTSVKRSLTSEGRSLTWDDFASMLDIEPRTFKTYRMPDDSKNFRKMPSILKEKIESLLKQIANKTDDIPLDITFDGIIPALAALTIRQAYTSLIDQKMISGTMRYPTQPIGLTSEDHRAMSLLSSASLYNGLPDYGAEIHQLLFMCTKPLGEWLPIREIKDSGMESLCLIDPDDMVPTAEAQDLAVNFTNLTTHLENQLFYSFKEKLTNFPDKQAFDIYTRVRENIVRYPVICADKFTSIFNNLPAVISVNIQQNFYEPVPDAWEIEGSVKICKNCGNSLKREKKHLACRTNACSQSLNVQSDDSFKANTLLRVNRGIKQYWVEPGFDEIKLYDSICQIGIEAHLYPKQDIVDIEVGDIGIDLKAYTSPETLGNKFNLSLGGLSRYKHKWVVVPDSLIKRIPNYLKRLRSTIKHETLLCYSVSEALEQIIKEESSCER